MIYFLQKLLIIILVLFTLTNCNNNTNNNNINNKPIDTIKIKEESIFNLNSKWKTQHNETIYLKDLNNKVLVIVMIYTSCKAACPRLVADMRSIEKQIPKNKLNNISFVLVSIDPENDTPQRLLAFSKTNKMEANHWIFLQGDENSTQEFANVLAVKYKEISPMDFSHSNIISVFDKQGVLVYQQEGLNVNNKKTVDEILKIID